ncbi:MAG: pyruvate ferredoxin oxidoreductase [Candidatus Thermoplasmatota archaeon]
MRTIYDGNRAGAEAAKLARVEVVSAYPISPQTTIVEWLSQFINDGLLNAKIIRVESEHSALSAVAGASLCGARTFTASCSQGLQLMSEVLYFTSGMRLPVVMAVANRTLSMPVNIWCDHQDSLVNRDSGWLQFYASSNQEVYDLIIQAYKICEEILLPAMVCYDGFILSHSGEVVETVEQEEVDKFLPKKERITIDVKKPLQFGEVLYPEWYPDFEYKKHIALLNSKENIKVVGKEFEKISGRGYGLIEEYRTDDADIILLALGSIAGTAKVCVDELRKNGEKVGVIKIISFRPFPENELKKACENASIVGVIDRDIGYGTCGMVYPDVVRVLRKKKTLNFIVGLGGKDVPLKTIEKCYSLAKEGKEEIYWPDLTVI